MKPLPVIFSTLLVALPAFVSGKPPAKTPAAAPSAPAKIAETPDQAALALQPGMDSAPDGIYLLENAYSFNVLDAVYYDPASGQLSLTGHFDKRFQGPRIPYLQHLATLMESPKPEFSLTWTPDSGKRIDALFTSKISAAQGDSIASQWGELFDKDHKLTRAGRYLLPALGVSPIMNNRAPGSLGVKVTQDPNSAPSVAVSEVAAGSPAAAAGIQKGDFILGLDGRSPLLPAEFDRAIRVAGAGNTVTVGFFGRTGRKDVPITLVADADTDVWKGTGRYDVLRALYLAANDPRAADVINVMGIMDRNNTPGVPPAIGNELRRQLMSALGLDAAVNADLQAVQNHTMTDANAGIDITTRLCRAMDATFHFNGTPVTDTLNRELKRGNGAKAVQLAMLELDRQMVPQVKTLLNPIFERPQGLQIPPELVEDQFHVHPEMVPQYPGVPAHSLLARAMFDGDYLCKRLMNRPDLKQTIPGYETSFEFEVKHPAFRHVTGTYRIWISVDKMDAPQSPDGRTLAFRDVKMRFNIREQGAAGGDLPNKPGSYEELLTSLWNSFEQQYPTLHELREAAKLAAAAKWILQQTPSAALPKEGRVSWQGPDQVPGLVFFEMAPDPAVGIAKTKLTIIAEGGVSLTPFPQTNVNNPNPGAQGNAQPFPSDPSVVDLSGLGDAPAEILTPALFTHQEQESLASQIFHKKIIVPDLHPAGWVKEFSKGQTTYDSVSVTLSQLAAAKPADTAQAILLREKLERIRQVSVQLAQTERALNILDEKNAGQAREFQDLQKEIEEDRDKFYEHMFNFTTGNMLEAKSSLPNFKNVAEAGEFASEFKEDVDYFEDLKKSVNDGSATLASLEAGVAHVKRFSEDLQKISAGLGAATASKYFEAVTNAKKFEDVLLIEADFAKVNFISDFKVEELGNSNDATRAALKDKLLPLQKQQSDELDTLCNDPQLKSLTTPAADRKQP